MAEPIRILHVDDDPEFLDLAATYLEREDDGFAVDTAPAAAAGLERLGERQYDCIISDYEMPGRNGIAFLEAVRESHGELPFVLYTGKGSEEVASDAIAAGVTEYIQKETGTGQYTVLAHRVRNAVEQYRSRRAVAETEELLSQIADKSDDILFVFDGEWEELLFVNASFEEIWGVPREHLADDPSSFLDFVHPDDVDRARESMARLSRGEPDEVEYRIVRPDGEQRWIRGQSKPILDDGGSVDRIVGYVRDVTDRIAERREREQIVERVTDGIIHVDADWTFTLVNDQAEALSGMAESALLGRDFWEVFEEAQGTRFEREYREVMDAREPTSFVEYFTQLEGWFDIEAYPLEDGGIAFYFRDVTDRVERSRELERQIDQFRYVEAAADIGYWEIDLDTPEPHEVHLSDGVYRIHGLPVGDPFDLERGIEYYHPEDRDAVRAAVERAIDEGEPYDLECRLVTESGDERWVSTKGEPIESDGEVVTVRGVFQDVTDRKEYEEQLSRQNLRLNKFASIVSHDLRNPLSVVAGRVELLAEECDSEHLERITDATDRMDRIIEDMLWLAREGQDIGATEPVALRTAVEDAWHLVGDGVPEAELRVEPEDGAGPTIEADVDRLRQLLENLLANAVEHAGPAVTVTVGPLADGFFVEDDGPGIPEARRDVVFEAGYSEAADGNGFGLEIVERIVDAHGWAIEIVDGTGGGARFEITGVRPASAGTGSHSTQ